MKKIDKGHPLSQSTDFMAQNIETLKTLFPTIVKEGKIDIKELQALLGDDVETEEEYYRFTWAGKSMARREANKPSTATLRPDKESSKDWDTTQNIFIEGDNLEVLKLLQKSYANKIKMIYIDPPYNTGKDFIYKDDFSDNLGNYLAITGQADDLGKRINTNSESDGRYHSNWLTMMYPRLKLARNLLKEDGVIFISIDDNEAVNLKKICDEVFGEENFQTVLNIQVRYADKSLNEEKPFKPLLEYIYVYSKSSLFNPIRPIVEYTSDKFIYEIEEIGDGEELNVGSQSFKVFKNGEWRLVKHEEGSKEKLKETWITGSIYSTMSYGKVFQKVVEPRISIDGLGCLYKVFGRGDDGLGYRYYTGPQKANASKGKMYSGMPLERIEEMKTEQGALRYLPIPTFNDFSADFGNIRHEGGVAFNSGKKPIVMLKQLINWSVNKDENAIILDFFAGSGSTAHAVMQQNAEDNGNRKFICVQLPEPTDEKSEAYRDGFLKISDITKERIQKASVKIASDFKFDLFKNESTGIDLGLRAFKLDSSNIRAWDGNPDALEDNLFNAGSNIKENRTEEDVLYEILLKYGLDLTMPIEQKEIAGKLVFNIGMGALFICLGDNITTAVAEGIGKWKEELQPATSKVIFKDNGFTVVDKTNSMQILKRYGILEVNTI